MFYSVIMRTVQSQEPMVIADIAASWKQRSIGGRSSAWQSIEKGRFKDETIAQSLLVSSYVPTLKRKVEQQLSTWKQLLQLLQETNKQVLSACKLLFNFVF